jgi:hypothetical protein
LDLDSSEQVEGLSGKNAGFALDDMVENTLAEVSGLDSSEPVEVMSGIIDDLAPEA